LWYGYRNWEETPSMNENATSPGPPRNSLYTDLIYWAQKPNAFGPSPSTNPTSNIHLPIQALLYLVCGEWLAITEYIRTRLGQIEWEVSFPDHFLNKHSKIDIALEKLHIWRRLVPLYCEMLAETLQRAFQFPCHGTGLANGGSGLANIDSNPANSTGSTSPPTHCPCLLPSPVLAKQEPVMALHDDFIRIHAYMADHQQHIDRLTNVVTSVISIYERRRGIEDSRNVTRLTWLATFFIPLSFVATLFAMQEDIGSIRQTIKWYFAAALPLAFLSLGLAFVLADHRVQTLGTKITAEIAAFFGYPKTKSGKKSR
jgi:hypothetical protein